MVESLTKNLDVIKMKLVDAIIYKRGMIMKKMKKLAVGLILIISTTMLYGCWWQNPDFITHSYFGDAKNGHADIQKLFTMMEDESNQNIKRDFNGNSFSQETQNKLLKKLKGIDYKVESENIDGDRARVRANIKGMDLNIIVGKAMEETFSYIHEQAISGVQISEKEKNDYFDNLVNKYLDQVTYSDRVSYVDVEKVDKKWIVKESAAISKLLLGIDEYTFSSENQNPEKVQAMNLNTPFTVETELGNYNLTIEDARAIGAGKWYEFGVNKVVLDYNYENISFGVNNVTMLYIGESAFQVLDDEGNIVDTYPTSEESRIPENIGIGEKCSATVTFKLKSDSKNLNVVFTRGSRKICKITVPIN